MYSASPVRAKPHRQFKPGYKSPSTIRHSKCRRRFFNNWEILSEYYAIDLHKVKVAAQDYYFKFKEILENGETLIQTMDSQFQLFKI